MTKSFKTLRERMTPEAQARARAKTADIMKDMAPHELGSVPELTQGALAKQLNLEQPAVSKLERRTDHLKRRSTMKAAKRKRLERAGWRLVSTEEFLELSDEENELVEIKLARADAERMKSSDSRVAKIEPDFS